MANRREFITKSVTTMAGGAAMLASPGLVRAQSVSNDLAIIGQALTLHPGLYRYNTQSDIDGELGRLARDWACCDTLSSRYIALQRFLSTIRCGHTHCNFYNQSEAVVTDLFERRTRLPFAFAWLDEGMVVTEDLTGTDAIHPGTQVLALNGRDPATILAALMSVARADGSNNGKRRAQLEMRNTDRFEYFDIFQGLLFPPADGAHRLTARLPDGRTMDMELPAVSLAERQAGLRTPMTEGTREPLWTWEMRGEVALLTMPSWAMFNSGWDWRSWLDERLRSLTSTRGLVVDLRDNEGGNDCGNVILSRLTPRDLQFPGYRRLVRYRETPRELDPYLDTWDRSFRRIGLEARDLGNGSFQLPGLTEETDFISAATPRITVPVAALVSPVCSSATFSFARRAKQSGLVRLFGETTGGNLRGINGGAYFFVRLPVSGIEFDIPLIGYFPADEMPDAGVDPDVFVYRAATDLAQGQDACLEAALDWVARS